MSDFKEDYLLSRGEYGALYPYLMDENVSSVFWNGRGLWVEEDSGNIYPAKETVGNDFVDKFIMLLCTRAGKRIGEINPIQSVGTTAFSATLYHSGVAPDGAGFIIKKAKNIGRPDAKELVEGGFCTENEISYMRGFIKARKSILLTGGNERDRLGLMRFMSRYIEPQQRTVVLERKRRLNIARLNPGKDVFEMLTGERSISEMMMVCRELLPKWVICEVRDVAELCDVLLECDADTGVAAISDRRIRKKEMMSFVQENTDVVCIELGNGDGESEGIRKIYKSEEL